MEKHTGPIRFDPDESALTCTLMQFLRDQYLTLDPNPETPNHNPAFTCLGRGNNSDKICETRVIFAATVTAGRLRSLGLNPVRLSQLVKDIENPDTCLSHIEYEAAQNNPNRPAFPTDDVE